MNRRKIAASFVPQTFSLQLILHSATIGTFYCSFYSCASRTSSWDLRPFFLIQYSSMSGRCYLLVEVPFEFNLPCSRKQRSISFHFCPKMFCPKFKASQYQKSYQYLKKKEEMRPICEIYRNSQKRERFNKH